MTYIYQHKDFPNFTFDQEVLSSLIQEFAIELGVIKGLIVNLSQEEKEEFLIQVTLSEAMKTSEIEGEMFSREDVMSSIRMQLGLINHLPISRDQRASAVAELMIEVRKDYKEKLTADLIKKWHYILFARDNRVMAGEWRSSSDAMQIISSSYGSIQIHYEAPPSANLPTLMDDFIKWYNNFSFDSIGTIGQAMLKASLVHLYFETIHPFEDGNGRIGRAIAEKALAESLDSVLYISLSKQIEKDRKRYYEALKVAQRDMDVTDWLVYFFEIIKNAENDVKNVALFTIQKTKFFDSFKEQLNERQLNAIQKMMAVGSEGFQGGMTAKKYMSINKISKATATRDLQELTNIGAFVKEGGGRSISYHLDFY